MQLLTLGICVVVGGGVAWLALQLILFVLSLALGIIWNLLLLAVFFFIAGAVASTLFRMFR